MSKESSKRAAKIAAIGIKQPQTLTFEEIKSLSASVLAQKEKQMEIVRVMGDGRRLVHEVKPGESIDLEGNELTVEAWQK
jgi:hypothetical protein